MDVEGAATKRVVKKVNAVLHKLGFTGSVKAAAPMKPEQGWLRDGIRDGNSAWWFIRTLDHTNHRRAVLSFSFRGSSMTRKQLVTQAVAELKKRGKRKLASAVAKYLVTANPVKALYLLQRKDAEELVHRTAKKGDVPPEKLWSFHLDDIHDAGKGIANVVGLIRNVALGFKKKAPGYEMEDSGRYHHSNVRWARNLLRIAESFALLAQEQMDKTAKRMR
jgi:hypothetical protein